MSAEAKKEPSTEYKSTCDEAQAFLNSEREYVENGLRVGFETFLNRLEVHNKLNQSIISDDDVNIIFSNYRTLYNANSKLFDDLMLLRLDGKTKLRDNLGKYMVDFIPYFRIYTDYIVKKQSAIVHLHKLTKSNKKFRHFLKINEMCAGRKLKSFLEEPVARLPQYLQNLAGVYVAFEHEKGIRTEAALNLLQAIVDIKKVTDEIAVKCRDLKARLLVGALQKDVFGNKIQLLAAHRYCISHASMNMVVGDKSDKIKLHKFILCNDVLVVSTLASSFKSGQLIAVYPLIGLRIAMNPKLSELLVQNYNAGTDKDKLKYRFAIVPQNKNFTPSPECNTNYMGSIIILCAHGKQMDKWINTIEDTVDEEEHNLKPCNPVDLEKRLRKQKPSREGEAETITITDPEKIKEIEQWKQAKASGQLMRPKPKKKVTPKFDDSKSNNSSNKAPSRPPRKPPIKLARNKSTSSKPSKPPSKPPPRRGTLNAHKRQRSGPLPPAKHVNAINASNPDISPAPPAKKPPNIPPHKSKSAPKTLPPKKNSKKPSKYAPPPPINESRSMTKVPTPKSSNGASKKPTHRKNNSRMNMLAGIQSFSAKSLKHVDAETLKKNAEENPQNVTNLLQSTLKNYRQFVMDDDDSDDSDGDWDDY